MRIVIEKIRRWFVHKKEGLIKLYCPGCGRNIADVNPKITGTFTCGNCGTKWERKIIDKT